MKIRLLIAWFKGLCDLLSNEWPYTVMCVYDPDRACRQDKVYCEVCQYRESRENDS